MKKIKKMFLLLFSSLACTLIISNSITNGAEKEKKWGDFIPIGVEVTPWETIFPQLVVNWNLATNEAVGTAYYHVGITKRIMVLNYFIFCKSFAPFTGIVKFDKYVDQLANNYPSATTAADNIANDTTQPWNKTRALLALKAFDDTIKNASSATLSKEFSDAYLYVLQNFDLIYNAPFGFLVAFISNDPENEYYLGINIRYNFDPELTDISKNATESIRNPVIIQVPTNSTSCLDLVENSNGILDTTVSTYNTKKLLICDKDTVLRFFPIIVKNNTAFGFALGTYNPIFNQFYFLGTNTMQGDKPIKVIDNTYKDDVLWSYRDNTKTQYTAFALNFTKFNFKAEPALTFQTQDSKKLTRFENTALWTGSANTAVLIPVDYVDLANALDSTLLGGPMWADFGISAFIKRMSAIGEWRKPKGILEVIPKFFAKGGGIVNEKQVEISILIRDVAATGKAMTNEPINSYTPDKQLLICDNNISQNISLVAGRTYLINSEVIQINGKQYSPEAGYGYKDIYEGKTTTITLNYYEQMSDAEWQTIKNSKK